MAVWFKQIVPPVAVTVGKGLTTTVDWEVLIQPVAVVVPVTVYVVVVAGDIVKGFKILPVLQA